MGGKNIQTILGKTDREGASGWIGGGRQNEEGNEQMHQTFHE